MRLPALAESLTATSILYLIVSVTRTTQLVASASVPALIFGRANVVASNGTNPSDATEIRVWIKGADAWVTLINHDNDCAVRATNITAERVLRRFIKDNGKKYYRSMIVVKVRKSKK